MYLSKCCYFVPLRIGLLVFAVLKILAIITHYIYFDESDFPPDTEEDERDFMMVLIIGGIMKLIQVLFTGALIIGIVKRKYDVVHVCYVYSAVILALELLKCIVYIPLETYRLYAYIQDDVWWPFCSLMTSSLLVIGVEFYFVVLIRSHLCSMKECVSSQESSAESPKKPRP
ncbi:unnamed protein product [Leptidea sinapis]|uniref:Uncharacterized protein n=1 Tax=Leptidea sinapis TaxID=189913 RepID=A0A5E4QTD5_9NEOP|nr:unnamed protein product [Leptidea sinapis]